MLINGVREVRKFEKTEDVWKVIDLIIKESKELNEEGMELDMGKSVSSQLPFFCCPNLIQSRECQKDIERYVYCEQFGIPPYPGSYGEQPAKWVDKAFLIKNTFAKDQIDGSRKNNN